MRLFFIFLIFLAVINSCRSPSPVERINKRIDSSFNAVRKLNAIQLISEIKSDNDYEDEYGGLGFRTVQYERARLLMDKLNENQVIQFCDDPNPVLRCYAFNRLVDKQSSKVFQILIQHLHDTTLFERTMGCMGGSDEVTDFFLEKAGYTFIDSTGDKLSYEQRTFIDSALLFGDEIKRRGDYGLGMKLISRYYMLERFKDPKPSFYKRIRELAASGEVAEALFPLSQYKKDSDVPIFKKYFASDDRSEQIAAFTAAYNFPHPGFYAPLKKIIEAESRYCSNLSDLAVSYKFYFAFMRQNTKDARAVVEKILKKSDECSLDIEKEIICSYLHRHPEGIFKNIIKCAAMKTESTRE